MRIALHVWIACLLITAPPPTPAFGQDAASAGVFLRSVYKNYSKGGPGVDFTGPKARRFFSSSLIALLHADQKAAGLDEPGALDGDPVCSCQDWDAVRDLKIALQLSKDGRAKAAISFELFPAKPGDSGDPRSLEISLVSQAGQWRIDNILDKSDAKTPFNLRAELEQEIRAAPHRTKALPVR